MILNKFEEHTRDSAPDNFERFADYDRCDREDPPENWTDYGVMNEN